MATGTLRAWTKSLQGSPIVTDNARFDASRLSADDQKFIAAAEGNTKCFTYDPSAKSPDMKPEVPSRPAECALDLQFNILLDNSLPAYAQYKWNFPSHGSASRPYLPTCLVFTSSAIARSSFARYEFSAEQYRGD